MQSVLSLTTPAHWEHGDIESSCQISPMISFLSQSPVGLTEQVLYLSSHPRRAPSLKLFFQWNQIRRGKLKRVTAKLRSGKESMTYTDRGVEDHWGLWGNTQGQDDDPEGQRGPEKYRSGAHLLMRGKTIPAATRRSQQLQQKAIPWCSPRAGTPAAEYPASTIPSGPAVATSRSRTSPRGHARNSRFLP